MQGGECGPFGGLNEPLAFPGFRPRVSTIYLSIYLARAAGWTPEEAARYQVALLRGLAADRKAQRLYLRKVQIVEMM
mgnify:CR=1 FL=1